MDKEELVNIHSQIGGYSAIGVTDLLNGYVCPIPTGKFYCEVGSFKGLTLVAALHGNNVKAISIDNFSEFGGKESDLKDNLVRYGILDRVQSLSMDFRKAFPSGKIGKKSIAVYFYDGAHDYQSQMEGLKMAEPYLMDGAIVIVDDTNWEEPKRATLEWAKQDGISIIENIVTEDFNTSPFWNGIIVCRYK